jgi:hypothetical protein
VAQHIALHFDVQLLVPARRQQQGEGIVWAQGSDEMGTCEIGQRSGGAAMGETIEGQRTGRRLRRGGRRMRVRVGEEEDAERESRYVGVRVEGGGRVRWMLRRCLLLLLPLYFGVRGDASPFASQSQSSTRRPRLGNGSSR